eukprot:Selendium_serpulae@DN5568_c0_g1_i1.p1
MAAFASAFASHPHPSLTDTFVDSSGRFDWKKPEKCSIKDQLEELYKKIEIRDKDQPEFLQAVREVIDSLEPVLLKNPKYLKVLETIAEPERVMTFRVCWVDDKGVQQVNRGYRVQFSSALGPYKGGLRFHPTVNLGIIKFLGFEQIFKNSLTTLQLGGGKGGSDFDPKGKSDNEIMRFCQSFMTALWRDIGQSTDVPAGDIGVGGREIGYLFGQYKRLQNSYEGVLTGKNPKWGGSLLRPEATGYGAVYFVKNVLQDRNDTISGKRCLVSGSGNVAQYCAEKLIELGAKVLTLSDSGGYVLEENGFTKEQLEKVMHLKEIERKRISEYTKISSTAKYFPGKRPWEVPCDIAFPSATQNEIEIADAIALEKGGCKFVVEGANMPSDLAACTHYKKAGITLCPAKAANAGGVAVSGLEMAQNSARLNWESKDVDVKLQTIMKNIYEASRDAAKTYGRAGDLAAGANIAGFLKLAEAVIEQGCL